MEIPVELKLWNKSAALETLAKHLNLLIEKPQTELKGDLGITIHHCSPAAPKTVEEVRTITIHGR